VQTRRTTRTTEESPDSPADTYSGTPSAEVEYLSLARGVLAVGAATATATTASFGVASAVEVCAYFDATRYYSLYLIAQQVGGGVGTLIAGGLVDRKGPRAVLRDGVVLSMTAPLLALALPWFAPVVLLCLVAGVGSGFCIAAAVAGAARFGRPRDRMRLFGASSAIWGISGIGVPLLVVVLIDLGEWHAVFVARAAVAATGYLVYRACVRALPKERKSHEAPRDVPGLALLVCGALTAQLVIGLPQGKWITLPVAVVLVAGFWWHIGRTDHPIFNRAQVAGRLLPFHVAGGAAFLGAWGLSAVLPLVLHQGLGTSSTVGALGLTLSAAGWLAGSLLSSGPLGRLPTPVVLYGGFCAQALILLLGACGLSTHEWGILGCAVAVGVSGGVANNASLGLASSVISPDDMGPGLSALQFLRGLASGAGGGLVASLVVTYNPVEAFRISQLGAALITVLALVLVLRSRSGGHGSPRTHQTSGVAGGTLLSRQGENDGS